MFFSAPQLRCTPLRRHCRVLMTKRPTFRAEHGYQAADLVAYAHDHLRAAQHLWSGAFEFLDSAAYLAHLAVEILLKAHLLHATGAFPGTHDLRELRQDLEVAGVALHLSNAQEGTVFLLDGFAASRYPKPDEPVQVGTGDLALLLDLWNHLARSLPMDLIPAYESISPALKGGRVLMVKRIMSE